MLSHPQPLSLLLKNPPLLPHPPQLESKRRIQMMEQHPFPLLLLLVPHPHPVAVKSLIIASKIFLFYGLSYVAWLVCVSAKMKK